jgi:uncharacterized protein HemX
MRAKPSATRIVGAVLVVLFAVGFGIYKFQQQQNANEEQARLRQQVQDLQKREWESQFKSSPLTEFQRQAEAARIQAEARREAKTIREKMKKEGNQTEQAAVDD